MDHVCPPALLDVDSLEVPIPTQEIRTIPIRLSPLTIKTSGFIFPEGSTWNPPSTAGPRQATRSKTTSKRPKSYTRIRPPADVIKLKDRLYFLLQPPLESIIGTARLTFPFEPFKYQLDGIAFLFPRYAAVLADEMGLGKTMQAISSIRLLLFSGELRNVLLICPKPLVTNWLREFRIWAPEIPVAIIEGESAKRYWQWRHPAAPVKIANYELLMRDRELLNENGLHFDLVVLDEAQRIKNRSSTTSEIARGISRTRAWALTGTPIENSPEDLVGIFEFLSPGYLKADMRATSLGKATKDFVLRRTKDMVLKEMPPKLFRDAELELTEAQADAYRVAEDQGVVYLEGLKEKLTVQHVFELVLRLKQICNFDPRTGESCKLERLVADLEEVAASGQKAIVFSQWVKSIDKMRPALERFGPLEYHGRIPHKKRDAIIEQFRHDPKRQVLLMSYGAGSVGLNLQFCQYVFLFDRWWNPAIEDQAINRAHRIGVSGPVTVTRMTCLGTIEQRIGEVLQHKRELFDAVFTETGHGPTRLGMTREEIFGLFSAR
jgi:SNF2 family DNA or RNA helicase